MKRLSALLAALALAGCTMIPHYEAPVPPVPETFPGATAEAAGELPAAATLVWSDFLVDPKLRAVVEQALAGNRDLRMASLNVDRVAALSASCPGRSTCSGACAVSRRVLSSNTSRPPKASGRPARH